MTDKPENARPDNDNTPWYKNVNKKAIALATGTAIVVGGAFGVQAVAGDNAFSHLKLAASGEGWSHHGWHRRGFSQLSDAEVEDRITRIVKHVAIEIDANEDQQKKITALVTAVAKDMRPLRDQMRATGKEVHDLLLADAIDRDALEKIRVERLAEADRISKNLVTALADVAEVLTPSQRKVLDERIQEFRSMRHRWRRG